MKKNLALKFVILSVFLIFIAVGANGIIFAQGVEDGVGAGAETCAFGMNAYFEKARKEYLDFVEKHFQSKSPNSELVNVAVEKYKQYKKNAYAKYNTYRPTEGGYQTIEAAKLSECQAILTDEIEKARSTLKTQMETTSGIKKQTVLIQKYQAINDGLRKLTMSFAEMKGYFESFNNKLPKFIEKCLP